MKELSRTTFSDFTVHVEEAAVPTSIHPMTNEMEGHDDTHSAARRYVS